MTTPNVSLGDNQPGEYFDLLDDSFGTAAAQMTTILLILGTLIGEGLRNMAQADANLALQAALTADALSDLHTGVNYMRTVTAQLTIAQTALQAAQNANTAARTAIQQAAVANTAPSVSAPIP